MTFGGPMLLERPAIPFDLLTAGFAIGWMLIGVAVVWDAGSRVVELLALLAFTIPAIVVVVLGPAIVLILQNMG